MIIKAKYKSTVIKQSDKHKLIHKALIGVSVNRILYAVSEDIVNSLLAKWEDEYHHYELVEFTEVIGVIPEHSFIYQDKHHFTEMHE